VYEIKGRQLIGKYYDPVMPSCRRTVAALIWLSMNDLDVIQLILMSLDGLSFLIDLL